MKTTTTIRSLRALALAGASALYADAGVADEDLAVAEALFAAVGRVVRVESESLMDAVTALSSWRILPAAALRGLAKIFSPALSCAAFSATNSSRRI